MLGMKTEGQADQAAFYVPKYLVDMHYDVVPVPVYYPEVTQILGREVVRDLRQVSPAPDMVNVFRRSKDLMAHVDDILALRPKSVWTQQGIKDAAFAKELSDAGIDVVMDRCLMVEIRMRPQLRRASLPPT